MKTYKISDSSIYPFNENGKKQECYSINKTSIRKNYSGVTEIVELKSK